MSSENINQWIKASGYDFLQTTLTTAEKLDPEKNQTLLARSLSLCQLVATLSHDPDTLRAALILPFFTDSPKTREFISNAQNPSVYKILRGTQKMEAFDKLPFQEGKALLGEKNLDTLRKLLLAIVDDTRIVLVKLAERLSNLASLRQASREQQQIAAAQTMKLYAPLANRLGIGQLKWQLEDWAFRYLEPESYSTISKALKQRREDREAYIQTVHEILEQLLRQSEIKSFEISGRAKHIYSIHRKLQRKQLQFDELYDANAFRVLVKSIHDCYTALSLLHEKWPHIEKEFDDYIAKPKPNGYRSIHTVVIGPNKHHIEIQIRTFKMHEEAELGVAAHWKYKEGKQQTDAYEAKISLLRDVMSWQQELSQPEEKTYQQLFNDRVYIFTPENDILDLQSGATPLDVAYHIHTQVGHRCKGAKINGKMVPITYPVKTGDVIEIITAKQGEPSRDWLNSEQGYMITHTARQKVKAWFHQQLRDNKLEKGQEIWDKAAKRERLSKSDLAGVLKHFNYKSSNDLLIALGSGHLGISAILRQLRPSATPKPTKPSVTVKKPSQTTTQGMRIAGTENLLTQLARCCQPLPGDTIVGYLTKSKGVSIHRHDCKNITRAMGEYPERILDVSWGTEKVNAYPVEIEIQATERQGLIRDISTVITNEKITLLAIHSATDKACKQTFIKLSLEISNLERLTQFISKLRKIPGTNNVYRKG